MIDRDLEFLLEVGADQLPSIAASAGFNPLVNSKSLAELPLVSQVEHLDRLRAELIDRIGWVGVHRAKRVMGKGRLEYRELARSVASTLRIKPQPGEQADTLEARIVTSISARISRQLSDEDKAKIFEELKKDPRFKKVDRSAIPALASGAAALAGAQVSGFGIYLGATTALGFLSGALGIALPFAAYTALTSSIAVIIGPVGWVALGVGALYQLGKPSKKRSIGAVLGVAAARAYHSGSSQ